MNELMLMRHAKSDWHAHTADIDRPLNGRGKTDAVDMGLYLKDHSLLPDRIVVSPSVRTQETVERMVRQWDLPKEQIITDDELYLASHETIIELAEAYGSQCDRLMILAHNPGMDYAVEYLSSTEPGRSHSGKLMVTAAIAHFKCPEPVELTRQSCTLLHLLRPRELSAAA